MNYISEIFESPSDQARLITTIIVTIMAVILVFVNQRFNSRRARNEKVIDKIEDIYSVINKMQTLLMTFNDVVVDNFNNENGRRIILKSYEDLKSTENNAYMLGYLYFDSIIPYLDVIKKQHNWLYQEYDNSPDLNYYGKSYLKSENETKKHYSHAYSELTLIMKRTMH